ncbi:MAG: hypothetical protein GF344_00645, partial [Chitinivibrionales bacterium]|nr:hypothetical protein [Chitinivibrionales bacterium]MBD3355629.1 hypothetical protein [Chitinivibrionales bacterium]
MTRPTLLLFAICMIVLYGTGRGQSVFEVTQLKGSAKVQRPPKREWVSLSTDDELLDNDIVETFFKARLAMRYGERSAVVLGSNSKALLNIKTESVDGVTKRNLNLTLFGGGLLVNNAGEGRVQIFTTNGVAELDSGTISAVVESKSGHTGFQILGGTARVRNVAQKEGKSLSAGQTTVILPGREPTPGLHLTYKHVSVLKHFFGKEYIEHEMEVSGIQPTSDSRSQSRISLSRNVAPQHPNAFGTRTYKSLFSLNKIYESILEDQRKNSRMYTPLPPPPDKAAGKVEAGFEFSNASAAGGMFPMIVLSGGVSFQFANIGLRLPLAKGPEGMSLNFNGADGILDKIDYLRFGSIEQGKYLYAGSIEHLTMGGGIVVDNFSNANPYSIVRPVGMYGRFENRLLSTEAFIADLTNLKLGGAHLAFSPGGTSLSAGYYFDANKNNRVFGSGNERFIEPPTRTEIIVGPGSPEGRSLQIVEMGLGVDLVNNSTLGASLNFAVAQKFSKRELGKLFIPPVPLDTTAESPEIDSPDTITEVSSADSARFDSLSDWGSEKGVLDGTVVRGPTFTVEFSRMKIGLGCVFEYGRMIDGLFNATYLTNRLREYTVEDTTYLWPLADVLSSSRRTNGLELFYGICIVPGTMLDLSFKFDYSTHSVFVDTFFTAGVTPGNSFDLLVSFAVDHRLVPVIEYGRCWLRQTNGAYFPPTGTFFASWGFETGFN